MDALKFRKRALFRQQAVDHFTGVHGQGTMPELLHPGRRRTLRALQLALALIAALWGTFVLLSVSDAGASGRTATEAWHD
ncbi:MAG: hypothetical protein RLW87_21720 [Alphaproteobacteria bacterium]|uniref:hypothetical protein n=1 Tax=Pacificispira sp. TaxID=2888761 RepID=UPI002E9B5E27|nr:hypothetical protein [Pseudomonadota bacterium]